MKCQLYDSIDVRVYTTLSKLVVETLCLLLQPKINQVPERQLIS